MELSQGTKSVILPKKITPQVIVFDIKSKTSTPVSISDMTLMHTLEESGAIWGHVILLEGGYYIRVGWCVRAFRLV